MRTAVDTVVRHEVAAAQSRLGTLQTGVLGPLNDQQKALQSVWSDLEAEVAKLTRGAIPFPGLPKLP